RPRRPTLFPYTTLFRSGMGCFDLGGGKIALVRNHELVPGKDGGGVAGPAFDTVARSLVPLPGGTTTLVLDAETLAVEKQYRSLADRRSTRLNSSHVKIS